VIDRFELGRRPQCPETAFEEVLTELVTGSRPRSGKLPRTGLGRQGRFHFSEQRVIPPKEAIITFQTSETKCSFLPDRGWGPMRLYRPWEPAEWEKCTCARHISEINLDGIPSSPQTVR
jgi:hypothetical protein